MILRGIAGALIGGSEPGVALTLGEAVYTSQMNPGEMRFKQAASCI